MNSPIPKRRKRNKENQPTQADFVNIIVWIEDKGEVRGPNMVPVLRTWRLRELRRAAERELAVPAPRQRWRVRRDLCDDDEAALQTLAGPAFDALFFLLVQSEIINGEPEEPKANKNAIYNELIQLERSNLVENKEAFECGVCLERCEARAGCVVRECLHAFCLECLGAAVRHCEEAEVRCPAPECAAALQEREVRALVSAADYERWLARGLAQAESGARHAFHCRTRDCVGWALAEPPAHTFPCPVCHAINCVTCQAIHEGETCEQYKMRLAEAKKLNGTIEDESTKNLIASWISRGFALKCPECSAVITKQGCDWVLCIACKTEICWATRGRRWGPRGRGDTSAGCRCGVGKKRCHPSCSNCH